MAERQPYSRVYWTVRKDDRLKGIYSDDHHLSAWLRLLIAADMAWPAPADLPASVRKASLDVLVDAGVVELIDGGLFIFHGLDTERSRRAEASRIANAVRWGHRSDNRSESARSPNGVGSESVRTPRRDETRRDEPSRDAGAEEWDGRDDLEAWVLAKHRVPTPGQRAFLDRYCATFDLTGPARAAKIILSNPEDPIAALKADEKAFLAERASAIVVEPKRPARRSSNGTTSVRDELAKLWREQERAEA